MRTEEYITLKRSDDQWHKVSTHLSDHKAAIKYADLKMAQKTVRESTHETAELWRARKLLGDNKVSAFDNLNTKKVLPFIYRVERQSSDVVQ
jgi:hypothetical protein